MKAGLRDAGNGMIMTPTEGMATRIRPPSYLNGFHIIRRKADLQVFSVVERPLCRVPCLRLRGHAWLIVMKARLRKRKHGTRDLGPSDAFYAKAAKTWRT